jgi:O-antigen ligase
MRTFDISLKMLLKKISGDDIVYVSVICIAFLLPIHYEYIPPFMILMVIGWLSAKINNKEHISGILTSKSNNIILILFLIFFIWQALTVIYSENVSLACSNVFARLSLVIFPLVLYNPGEKVKNGVNRFLRIFACSTALFILYRVIIALTKSISFSSAGIVFHPNPPDQFWVNYFLEREFAGSLHPTYLSMFVVISALIAFENFSYTGLSIIKKACWLLLGILMLFSLYLVSSRASVLAAIIVIPVYSVIKAAKNKRYRWIWIFLLLLLGSLIPLIKTNEKFGNLVKNLTSAKHLLNNQEERIFVWQSAVTKIKQNYLFGVGIGDVRTELTKEYQIRGQAELATKRLNAHNQFLEAFLEGGILEILILISIIVTMVHIAFHQKNLLYGLFTLMMIVFFMFETTLYRLAGIAFFSFFSFLLIPYKKSSE